MTMVTDTPRTPLHELEWTRSAKGHAIRTVWRGCHLSVYRRPNEQRYRFRLDGRFPETITRASEAIGYLWARLLSKVTPA